jgi:hypothetical protein
MEVNPLKDRSSFSDIFKHERIKHFIFTNEDFLNMIDKHFSCGAQFILNGKICSKQEVVNLSYNYLIPFNKFVHEASGEYVLCTGTDTIFPFGFKKIIKKLSHNVIYRCKRESVSCINFNHNDFENVLFKNNCDFLDPHKSKMYGGPNSVVKAPGDFILMDKHSWTEIGGFLPIPSNRLFAIDNYTVFVAMSYGKRIYAIDEKEYYIVNMHIPPKNKKMLKMNYIVDKNKVSFNYIEETKKSKHKNYIKWLKCAPYNGEFLYKDFNYKKRYLVIRKMLDSIMR